MRGDLDAVTALLDAHADTASQDKNGRTALVHAAFLGNDAIVRLLLDRGADPNLHEEARGWTPLMLAAQEGKLSTVELLLAHHADVNQPNYEGYTALMATAGVGRDEMAARLIEAGAELRDVKRDDGFTLLMAAASGGAIALVKRLLDGGAPINRVNQYGGWTALHFAATEGKLDVVKELLERGAWCHYRDKEKKSARDVAHASKRKTVADLLDDWQSSHDRTHDDALAAAIRAGNIDAVRAALDAGARPDSITDDGFPAVAIATARNDIAAATLLLDRGARPDAESTTGATALMCCLAPAQVARALLLDRGAGLESRQMNGRTALACAAQMGSLPAVEALVSRGADAEGHTPLIFAAAGGYGKVASYLLDHGANIDQTNHAGESALATALAFNQSVSAYHKHETAKALLARGAKATAEERSSLETVVFELPNAAPLDERERAIIDLIRAGKTFNDADADGGWQEFRFEDGRFVRAYGTKTGAWPDDKTYYGGESGFLRELLDVARFLERRDMSRADFLEAVRDWIK